MSKRANPTVIGAFVVGAVLLATAAILIFGSGKYFKETVDYVMFFDGSVKGLVVGAPLNFRGVRIGSVTGVDLKFNAQDLTFQIPVYAEIEPDRITTVAEPEDIPDDLLPELIERGLRAQLKPESLLTGRLFIQLDFHPDKPARLLGTPKGYREIPTIPSDLEDFMQKVSDLPIQELMESATRMVQSVEELASSPKLDDIVANLQQATEHAEKLIEDTNRLVLEIREHVDPLATGMEETLKDTRKLVQNVDAHVDPIATSIEGALEDARSALQQANRAIANLNYLSGDDSAVVYELVGALEEMEAAARSIRAVAEYLERHPEALLRGKGGSRGE